MRVKELLQHWESEAREPRTAEEYAVRLPISAAARLRALAQMYPGRSETQLITDLLGAALDELEEAFPYVEGPRVIAEDEQGDPIYEDIGPTARFYDLTHRLLKDLQATREKPTAEEESG